MRTVNCAAMSGARVWVALVTLHCMLAASVGVHHRRSMAAPSTLPVSKGGWRPVLNSGLPGYGAFGAAPLHASPYKYPVVEPYPSSSRPVPARDQTKLTSIAQSYRPTTLRSLPASSPPQNQPINQYYNPYLPNGLPVTYKYVQNYPLDNVVIRNPHNPYTARPVYPKYHQKFKQNYHQGLMQQLNNVQPLQFGVQFQHDYEKPVDTYVRPQHPPLEANRPHTQQGESRPQHTQAENSKPHASADNSRPLHHPQESSRPQGDNARPQHHTQGENSRPHGDNARPQHHTQGENSRPHGDNARPQHHPQGESSRPHGDNARPHYPQQGDSKRPAQQSSNMEIFKPDVYKLSDSDTSPQQVNQQVKTAQQQSSANLKPQINGYPHYQFKDEKYAPIPPSILGSFSSFGLQSMKGRDPIYPPAKTTYLPPQPIKQTIFNSFSFAPHFKGTPNYFQTTTPNLQYQQNLLNYGLQSDSVPATQPPKTANPQKVDPNAASKPNFKASPQDPFDKQFPKNDHNKIQASTYKPSLPTTTPVTSYFNTNFHLPSQYHQSVQTEYFQQPQFHYENKKQKIHDNLGASVNQKPSSEFPSAPHKKPELEATQDSLPRPSTYEVTEEFENDDIVTHPSNPWSSAPEIHDFHKQKPEEPVATTAAELQEEYAIVTEADKGYENSLSYDSHVETQSRRPLGDDFEPINKHKLKDYYYRVSTPTYDEHGHYKRTKKPTEEPTSPSAVDQEVTTADSSLAVQPLPTLPPNRHFKRPNSGDPMDKDKIRKRNKNRRRRPPLANLNRDKEESSTHNYVSSTQAPHEEEPHTLRPRIRPYKQKQKVNLTTPTITTDLSTSAIPTISPTSPTVVKKKILRRPQTTTTERSESTTISFKDNDVSKDSPIMKIATRPQHPRVTTVTFDYKPSEAPDYTHKQDEKDTPTSDVSVNLESYRNKPDQSKPFSFHKDVKPLEAKLEPIHHSQIKETTTDSTRRETFDESTDITTYAPRTETTPERSQRPRKKYDSSRPKFSVKDYRNRLSSTTSTEKPAAESSTPKFRFPSRRLPFDKFSSDSDNSTERKKFTPKDPRHKSEEPVTEREKEIQPRQTTRQRQTTTEGDGTTQKISSRIRSGSRRPRPTEETTDTSSPLPTTVHVKRPQRKKVKDSETDETVQDIAVTDTTLRYHDDQTSERTRSESAIMKIAKDDKKHQTDVADIFEHSKRVSDLTLAASKDYNNPGLFKTVSPNSRRVPNYFTIATDDPILPIEAFFPQLNQKKES